MIEKSSSSAHLHRKKQDLPELRGRLDLGVRTRGMKAYEDLADCGGPVPAGGAGRDHRAARARAERGGLSGGLDRWGMV